jgi:penicillin-binding protein 1A
MPSVLQESGWTPPYPFDDEPSSGLGIVPRLDMVAWRRRLVRGAARARALCRTVAFRLLAPPAAALLAVAGLGVRHVYFDRSDVPDLERFVRFEAPTVGAIEDSRGELLVELAREYRHVLRYQDLPAVMRDAIVSAEDKNFFAHSGIDYTALPRVIWKTATSSLAASCRASLTEERPRVVLVFPQGGSTLTQQIVRGYFLEGMTRRERGVDLIGSGAGPRLLARLIGVGATNKLVRKLEEARLSLWLEEEFARRYGSKRRAKQEILARYASFIYLGNGRYGFAAASEYYFGQSVKGFTAADADKAALLAGITKSPRDYAPVAGHTQAALRRRNEILGLMARNEYLPAELVRRSIARPVQIAAGGGPKTEAPFAVESVLEELKRQSADERLSRDRLFDGRIRVRSTLDNRIQQIVNDALEEGIRLYESRHPEDEGQVQASVVVLANADARILAEAGGRRVFRERYSSYNDYNRVTGSLRQPGSVMKPLVYLTAFRNGASLDSLVPDAPVAIPMGKGQPPKWVQNYDGKFKGVIRYRQALAESRNAATVRIAWDVGIPRVLETAHELGIRTPLQPYITTALGASEVPLIELGNAYRAMASGIIAEPHLIDRVFDASGAVVHQPRSRTQLLDADESALREIQEGLRGVVLLPGATAHVLASSAFPIPVMGKTGTTSDFRDALFVGSTYGPGGITVAVRVGYDDNRALGDKETGGRTALPIFRRIMLEVYGRALLGPVPQFPQEMERRIGVYATWASAQRAPAPADMAPAPTAADTDAVPALPVLHADLAQAAVGAGTARAGSASGTGALDAGVQKAMTVSMDVAGHKKTAEAGLAAPDVH